MRSNFYLSARSIFERCVGMQSSDDSADRPTDNDVDLSAQCGARARHLYAACIEDGGESRECGAVAHRALDACLSASRN